MNIPITMRFVRSILTRHNGGIKFDQLMKEISKERSRCYATGTKEDRRQICMEYCNDAIVLATLRRNSSKFQIVEYLTPENHTAYFIIMRSA
jgi:hypothetical protein